MKFTTKVKVRFHEADAAGILFHGNIFHLAHNVFEEFLDHVGLPWKKWYGNATWAAPQRHVEADYFSPLVAGEMYHVQLQIMHIGTTSFTSCFTFSNAKKKIVCEAKITTVFVDPQTITKRKIPNRVRSLLQMYLC